MNKGVKRLSFFLGCLAALAWLILILKDIASRHLPVSPFIFRDWMFIIVSTAVCFLIPFALVHAIAWVVRGFKD